MPTTSHPVQPATPYLPPPNARAGAVALLRVAGMLIVALLLLIGAGSIVSQFFQQRRTETLTIGQKVNRLVASSGSGDIRVRTGAPGSSVTVVKRLRWSFREPTVTVNPSGGTLTVTGRCANSGLPVGGCSADLELFLPPEVPIKITTGSGEVAITGRSGAVAVETHTGGITLADSTSPDVDVQTDTGDMTVRGGTTGSISAETGHGEITLLDTAATSVHAQTDSGDVTVSGGAVGARMDVRSSSGNLSLHLAQAPGTVSADTDTGDITVTVPPGLPYDVDTDPGSKEPQVDVQENSSAPRKITANTETGEIVIRTD